jgi:hypothetical protein
MREIFLDNLHAVMAYWWVILIGVIMPFLDLIKFLHPTRHIEFKLHPSLRIAIAAIAVILAQFLAYKDQATNLAVVTEDKRQLSVRLNSLNQQMKDMGDEIADLRGKAQPDKRETRHSLRRRVWRLADEIQRFWAAKRKEAPSSTPGEDQQVTNQKMAKWIASSEHECNDRFKEKILGLVQELDAKGIDTKIHGWLDYSVVLVQNQRCLEGDEWEAFRDLGYRVDAHDNKVEIQY